MTDFYAHSANESGQFHPLNVHLEEVAKLAREFAEPFSGGEAAFYLGLWHDIGKFDPQFQEYLKNNRSKRPDHKGAGAKLACQHLGPGGLIVQGHHGGLKACADLRRWVAEKGETDAAIRALEAARRAIPGLEPTEKITIPDYIAKDPVKAEFWVRMVFSAVVDADFLDTERHFNQGKATSRSAEPALEQIRDRFHTRHSKATAQSTGAVNEVRSEIHQACLNAASSEPGVFRLTAPTGGGKTLSAMAFALKHASTNNLKRIIVATPYTSITQQTASVYRSFLENEADESAPIVLEHHSMADLDDQEEYDDDQEEYDDDTVWQRLAAENWDAPVIVTTTVQLFQSLFSNRTSSTRKLHRLAQSVIILDEAQCLPPRLLTPILDALKELVENYSVTIVLSTATQPTFQAIPQFAAIPATEIVPEYQRHFQKLKRVNFDWSADPKTTWDEIAKAMMESPQVLTIVNTKKDALDLLDALEDEEAIHLSTFLCGRHRQRAIQEIRGHLREGRPCRVVSTQVVEAGVDIDFPLVMRAIGPLDSIIQAGQAGATGPDCWTQEKS